MRIFLSFIPALTVVAMSIFPVNVMATTWTNDITVCDNGTCIYFYQICSTELGCTIWHESAPYPDPNWPPPGHGQEN